MEPGLRDREYDATAAEIAARHSAAMEPGLRDREYDAPVDGFRAAARAAMEPGLRDREYQIAELVTRIMWLLQWSPVLETGNT